MLEFNDGKKMLKFSPVMKLPERELKEREREKETERQRGRQI